MPHDVFISFATEDKAAADAAGAALEARAITYWIAPRNILPAELYAREIVQAIDSSRVFVLILSSHSNRSPYVANEVGRAFSKEIPILSFRIEDVQPSDDLALYISARQWLDALEPPPAAHAGRLAEAVAQLLADRQPGPLPPPPTPRPVPPRAWWRGLPAVIAAGIVLATVAFAVWYSRRPPGTVGVGGPPTPAPTAARPGVNYEQLYNSGVEMLSDTSQSPHRRAEGVRLLSEVAASGDMELYWKAMDRLTDHVRTNARWDEQAAAPPRGGMPQDVFRALEAITARPPVYPAGADDKYKREHRRDLRFTDLRGLRLVGGAHFEYADLEGVNLDGAVLTGAELEGAMLRDASLRGANLSGAGMKGVVLDKADINGADLSGAVGLNWFDAGGAYNWQCATLDNTLRDEIRARLGPKVSAQKCQ